jgi:hypothetical protein
MRLRKAFIALATAIMAFAAVSVADTASACCHEGHGTMDTYSFPGD